MKLHHPVLISLVILAGALRSADGHAADEGLKLRWEAPSGCPGQADVRAGLERLAGSTAQVKPAVEARAIVERLTNGEWRVELETTKGGERGTRTLEAASCQALADSVTLILALMVQRAAGPSGPPSPGSGTEAAPAKPFPRAPRPSERAREATPRTPPPRKPPVAEPATSAPAGEAAAHPAPGMAPPRPSAVQNRTPAAAAVTKAVAPFPHGVERAGFAVGVAATSAIGILPNFAWGGGVTAAWLRGRWRLQAEGDYLARQGRAVEGHPAIVGEYSGLLGALSACLEPGTRRVSGGVCLGLEAGALHAVSSGARSDGSAYGPWLATQVTAAVEWVPTGRWGLRLELGGAASLRRPAFAIAGLGRVYEPPPVTARGKILAEMLF